MTPVEKFGNFITNKLRDQAIEYVDGLLAGHWKLPGTQNLQASLAELSSEERELVRRVVVRVVDSGIHDFLFALVEASDFKKGIEVIVDGQNIVALSDGLHGEPYSDEGWYARFSKFGAPLDIA